MSTPPMPMVQVFAPDGTLGDIPYDKLHDALGAGAKVARKVQAPDGTPGYVPADRINEALKAGAKPLPIDLSDADGGKKDGFWSKLTAQSNPAVANSNPLVRGLDSAGGALMAAPGQMYDAVRHPIDTATGLAQSVKGAYQGYTNPNLTAGAVASVLPEALGQGIGGVAGAEAMGAAPAAARAGLGAAGDIAGNVLPNYKPQIVAGAEALQHPAALPGKALTKLADLIPDKPEYPGASLPSYEDYAANRGAEMNKARAMQDIQMRREATAKATADRAAAKADDAARQPVPLTSSPNYPKWQADQAAAAQAAKDAARADAAARQPVPVSQSPYYAQNQAAQAAEEAARKPVPLNQSPYYTQNQAAAAPAQPLGSVYGPPTPTPEQLAQQGVKLSDLATPQAPPPTSEGRPATWTNDTVRKLAAWGDPDAVDQARARGFGTIQKNYSLADLNPRSVTRFSPEGVPLSDLLNSPGNQTLNPVGAGGARPIVSPADQFESSFGPEHQEVGDLAEWETGNRQGVKVGSDLDQAAKSMFGGKSFDTLTPEQKAHILRIAQTQVAVP